MLAKIPPYEVNEDGAIREWMHPDLQDNYHHRHESHLYPLFPGIEITADTDPVIFHACRTAVEKRLEIGLSDQSGWSLAHMASVDARLGEGDRSLACLELLARSCLGDNLFTYHNDWRRQGITLDFDYNGRGAPFQIDANFGWSAAVLEMLVFSTPYALSLLPALPRQWRKGKAHGVRTRCGIKVSLRWDLDKGRFSVRFESVVDQEVQVKFPAAATEIQTLRVSGGEWEPQPDGQYIGLHLSKEHV
jgi:alpha-L-fucosidase 2